MKIKKSGKGDDGLCDLECEGKPSEEAPGNLHEFVGPVKIVLVESTPLNHKRKIWGSALFTLVMLFLGATVFTVFFFTLKFKLPFYMNVHVLLCTMGFQLFMTTGIMMFSSLFGGSMHLKPAERKWQHFFLETSAVLLGLVGTFCAFESISATLHTLTGLIATGLSVLSCLVGPTVFGGDPGNRMFGLFKKQSHKNVAVPTFVIGTMCFVLGLMKDSFKKWAPIKHLHYILIVFTFIYSGTAMTSMVWRRKYDV